LGVTVDQGAWTPSWSPLVVREVEGEGRPVQKGVELSVSEVSSDATTAGTYEGHTRLANHKESGDCVNKQKAAKEAEGRVRLETLILSALWVVAGERQTASLEK